MNIEIANRLISLRKKNGYSKEELADKIGVSRQAVSKWEGAESSPDTDNLIALARLYRISLDELLRIEKPEESGEPETAGPDQAGSPNVTLKFRRSGLQKASLSISAEFVIDRENTVRVAPDTSAGARLEPGPHTVRASIPFHGNESYVVSAQVDVRPDTACEITYAVSSLSLAGSLSVKETSAGIYGESATTVTKGRKNHVVLFLILFIIFGMLGVAVPYGFSFLKEKPAVVTALNTPGVSAGVEITATEMKTVQLDGESAVAVYFKIENKSKNERYLYHSANLAYIDGVKAKSAYGENELALRALAAGKRVAGYLYYELPEGAKEIEIQFEVEHEEKFTFSLDLPGGEAAESEAQTGTVSVNAESNSTESKNESRKTESKNTQSEAEKEIVVTALNTPGVNAGIKMTAAEIKIVKPEYTDKSTAAVYFEVENQSREKIFISLPSAYVDDRKAEYTVYGGENFSIGYLDVGKRMAGYLYHYIPEGAKKIEMKFDVGLSRGLRDAYITFLLDIPPR